MSSVRIGTRLTAGFAVLIMFSVVIAVAGMWQMAAIKDDLDRVTRVNNVKSELLADMATQVHVVARVIRTLVLLSDPSIKEREYQKIFAAREAYQKAWNELQKFAPSDKGRQLREQMELARSKAVTINDRIIAFAKADQDAEATVLLLNESLPAVQAWQDAIEANLGYQVEGNARAVTHAEWSYVRGKLVVWTVLGLAVGSAALLAWLLTRSVTLPLEYARACALRMAEGDLSFRVERRQGWDGQDETSQLVSALQAMHESLVRLVADVHANAGSVASAAHQISQGNADLSSRTEQQASNLEQTAASMEQLTATVKQNAEHAHNANALTRTATDVVTRGGAVMGQVVQSMRGIHDGSQKIAEIIGVIDSIAFQTNILALNAAVEAARAGEQGRGFAVVASEVRNLAQRSASAAREIKGLISESVERVSSGTELVGRAGATFDEVVASIQRVAGLVTEITSASTEQANGIAQVGTAVQHMDQMTQQNAALVEESAAAAESLNAQAQQLVAAVSKFRLATA
jgi:methyl-accepting chemotaxis protein